MQKLLFKLMQMKSGKVKVTTKRWRPSVKAWRRWLRPGISWLRLVLGRVTKSGVFQIYVFIQTVARLGRKSGLQGLTLYLKTCHVLLQQSVPGTRIFAHSRAVGKVGVKRTHDGLPRLIPRLARAQIRAGNSEVIRLWLTLLGTYRVIEYVGKPNLDSIWRPGTSLNAADRRQFVTFLTEVFLPLLEARTGWLPEDALQGVYSLGVKRLAPTKYEPVMSASADSTKLEIASERERRTPATEKFYYSAFATRGSSASMWLSGKWGPALKRYLKLVLGPTGAHLAMDEMQRSSDAPKSFEAKYGKFPVRKPNAKLSFKHKGHEYSRLYDVGEGGSSGMAGRLVGLPEPAGKVRIVALVDYWTQWALKPLHEELFKILRRIPTDGTFDQLRPVERLLKKVSDKDIIYSYDLKSATDRLSIKAQMLLLSVMFSPRLAVAWKQLLVGRTYWYFGSESQVPESCPRWKDHQKAIGYFGLRYAQGQPMGAYSSWAMLALFHHVIVQWAAYLEGHKGWYELYAILGDDIVICGPGVAQRYRQLLDKLGVEVGIAKSLVSRGKTLEFAKRFYFRGVDCSGLPLKFWAAAQCSMSVASMLLSWYPHKSMSNFVRALGVGFKGASGLDRVWDKFPRRLKVLMVYLTHPLTANAFSFNDEAEWLWSHGPNRRWSSTDDGMVNAKPWLERVTSLYITELRDLVIQGKRNMTALFPRDPVSKNIDARAYAELVELEHAVEEFADTIEEAWWRWSKRSLNRIGEYAARVEELVAKAGSMTPFSRTLTFRKIEETPLFSISRVYRYWASTRKVVLREGVVPRERVGSLHEDNTRGDDW